jgi:hypothetical protein
MPLTARQLTFAPVISIYCKTGGKQGKYAWVEFVDKLVAASNIMVQVYQPKGTNSPQWSPSLPAKYTKGIGSNTFAILKSKDVVWAFDNSSGWKVFNGMVQMPHTACLLTNPIWFNFEKIATICSLLSDGAEDIEEQD